MMTIEWKTSTNVVPYEKALSFMEDRVDGIIRGEQNELIWALEHPPIYTSGTSSKKEDLLNPKNLPVYEAKRGGQYTYHGPGQRVIYVMLNLNKRGRDLRKFVKNLENWIIYTLSDFEIEGFTRHDRIGVWVKRPEKPSSIKTDVCEEKIAAVGIRLRKWVSFHGISVNVDPELNYYEGIVPCGISDYGVTSMRDLGKNVTIEEIDKSFKKSFSLAF